MTGFKRYISRLQGSTVRFDLRAYAPAVAAIGGLERELTSLADEDIRGRSRALRQRARSGESLAALRTDFFALAREASRRVLGQRPYDEQVLSSRCRPERARHSPR